MNHGRVVREVLVHTQVLLPRTDHMRMYAEVKPNIFFIGPRASSVCVCVSVAGRIHGKMQRVECRRQHEYVDATRKDAKNKQKETGLFGC